MKSMQQQLGVLGTISAFAYRHRETKKNPCRGGRSQDLPDTDLQPTVRRLQYMGQQEYNCTDHGRLTNSVTQFAIHHLKPCRNLQTGNLVWMVNYATCYENVKTAEMSLRIINLRIKCGYTAPRTPASQPRKEHLPLIKTSLPRSPCAQAGYFFNLLATDFYFKFQHTLYLKCNTETKQGSIMK